MVSYRAIAERILSECDRTGVDQLKKDMKIYLRRDGGKGGVIDLVDVKLPRIIVDMIANDEIKTMCEDDDCNESFGTPKKLPICDNCVIYPPKKILGFKRDPDTGKFLVDFERKGPDPYYYL